MNSDVFKYFLTILPHEVLIQFMSSRDACKQVLHSFLEIHYQDNFFRVKHHKKMTTKIFQLCTILKLKARNLKLLAAKCSCESRQLVNIESREISIRVDRRNTRFSQVLKINKIGAWTDILPLAFACSRCACVIERLIIIAPHVLSCHVQCNAG